MATIDLNHETICINPTDDLTLYDKNNIMSRIEKFLFAICSLDSSDLPVPLSRIEELYNCLVTGDTPPTLEPSSRAEKFLMACLGVYDINKLPEPLSRSEVLLKKIATCDSNLEDVDNLQSKYEFLLAYIIKNGGVGDFEKYILNTQFNTLYNTKGRPIKSAILKGNTLVNLATPIEYKTISYHGYCLVFNGSMLKSGKYTLKSSVDFSQYVVDLMSTQKDKPAQYRRIVIRNNGVFTIDDTFFVANNVKVEDFFICLRPIDNTVSGIVTTNEVENCEFILLEGDYTNVDIPYFTGMSSVRMPVLKTVGKNLCDEVFELGTITDGVDNDTNLNKYTRRSVNYYDIKGAQTLTLSGTIRMFGDTTAIIFYDLNKEYISTVQLAGTGGTTSVPKNAHFAKIRFGDTNTTLNVQLEESSVATQYEPFKSNILTVNEEVELRGIGEVQDELNLLTGELTQRIGEYSLDGSGNWVIRTDVYIEGYIYFQRELDYTVQNKNIAICERLPYFNETNISTEQLRLSTYNNKTLIGVRLSESKGVSSLDEFSEYLKSNPIKFKYPLTTESVKTVVLSIVNQDGNNTKLSTFNDITHVTLSSGVLIPEAELEVATKNDEVINTLSLEMDDISATQTTLEETTNTQNENVDATMIATTEIYEGLL